MAEPPNSGRLRDILNDVSESDDMEFEPATEEESDVSNDNDFLQQLLDGEAGSEMEAEIEVEIEEAEDEEADDTETERTIRQRRQVMRLLANSEIGRLFHFARDDNDWEDLDEDDDDLQNPIFRRRRRRQRPDPDRFPKIPSDNGMELMNSGTFGSNEVQIIDSGASRKKKKNLARRILDRELAAEGYAQQRVNQRLMAQVGFPKFSVVLGGTELFLGDASIFKCRYDYSL